MHADQFRKMETYSPKSSPRGGRSPIVSRQDSSGTLKMNISLGKIPSIVHSGPFYLMKDPPGMFKILILIVDTFTLQFWSRAWLAFRNLITSKQKKIRKIQSVWMVFRFAATLNVCNETVSKAQSKQGWFVYENNFCLSHRFDEIRVKCSKILQTNIHFWKTRKTDVFLFKKIEFPFHFVKF